MKVSVILGSPRRKGNSATLARIIAGSLAERGAEITLHLLNDLVFKGCQGCGACKKSSEVCVVNDELAPVLEDVRAAEVLILATPVYWGEVSAQLKAFIDRTYSYLTPDFMTAAKKHRLPPGKKLVFIQTQGADDPALFGDIFPRYNTFFEQLGYFTQCWLIRGCALNEPNAVHGRQDLLDQALTVAREIVAISAGSSSLQATADNHAARSLPGSAKSMR
ncbi:MAG TPA: flavodoxin family protein [Desulforhopalus sp.]|jgi:multimeric flavodoxin WrbA|nr:flavodoxin family protein [Desulforhopalus sp.]